MIGAIVDVGDLLQVVWVSLAAGLGVTAAFAVAIVGGTRAVELGRHGRGAEAAIFAIAGIVAMAAVVAAIAIGIAVLINQ
jgi:hypothetical protein